MLLSRYATGGTAGNKKHTHRYRVVEDAASGKGTQPKASAAHPAVSSWIRRSSHTEGNRSARFLLRKEVIQPHLPVRLPCYDFTPITDPTLGGSLPFGLGHRLRVKPALVV